MIYKYLNLSFGLPRGLPLLFHTPPPFSSVITPKYFLKAEITPLELAHNLSLLNSSQKKSANHAMTQLNMHVPDP